MMFLCIGAISFLMGCSNDNIDGSEFANTIDSTVEAIAETSAESRKEIEVFETNDPRILEVEKENAEEIQEHKNLLTLERVLELSEKEELDWSDFDGYACEDIGSGLYILKYDIDRDFYLMVGGTGQGEPMYVRLVSAQNPKDYLELKRGEQGGNHSKEKREEEKNNDSESEDYSPLANGREDVERFIRERSSVCYDVAITANVKEVGEDSLLIRSTNDAFPGVFSLIHVRDAMNGGNADNLKDKYQELALKGGMYIRVLMESTNQKKLGNDNIPVYEAKEITILPDDKVSARVDIQLTKAPELSLTDYLSSQYVCFSVQSGNYTWTMVNEDGEEKQVIACGSAPLDEAAMQEKEKLKIPNYPTENVLYGYSTKIPPDILTVRQWDISELGKPEAREEKIVVYYDGMNCLELCRDKIYEFTAEWMKENFQQNQFYGKASYVVVTE